MLSIKPNFRKEEKKMDENSVKLLKECSSGCKMAVKSVAQIGQYVEGEKLKNLLDSYEQKHKELDREISGLLTRYGEEDKAPSMMAEVSSWMKGEMKMMMHNDDHQVAKLMMDGCNMGIQSVSEYVNKYSNASNESQDIAKRLIKIEEDFMVEMKEFV